MQNDAQAPNVSFKAGWLSLGDLRGGKGQCAHSFNHTVLDRGQRCRLAEITHFYPRILKCVAAKNVRELQVAMGYAKHVHLPYSTYYLMKNMKSLRLCHPFFLAGLFEAVVE